MAILVEKEGDVIEIDAASAKDKKRTKRKRDPATSRSTKKPKQAQSPSSSAAAATAPPPPAEKKKPAAKRPKKATTAPTTKSSKKGGKANAEANVTPQTTHVEMSEVSQITSLPMVMPSAPSNTTYSTSDSLGLGADMPFKRSTDEDMDELESEIDISMWLDSTAAGGGTPSGSTNEFDAFFQSPVSTPATSQKTPAGPMSPIDEPMVSIKYSIVYFFQLLIRNTM